MLNVVVPTTGPLLSLDEAKLHLRIDDDDSDTLIEAYADAAVLSVLNHCDLKLVPQGAEPAFKLIRWENGALSLLDPTTGRDAEIYGFGPDHTKSFADMLEAPKS